MKSFQALKSIWTLSISVALVSVGSGCGENQVSGGGLEPPVLNPYPTLTNQPVMTVTGTKGSGTAIRYQKGTQDAVVAVEANESTTFEFSLNLDEGLNRFAIQATNANGRQYSEAAFLVTTLDTIPPRAPTCPNCPVSAEAGSTVELTGEKDAEANILSDEDEVVTFTDSTEWSYRAAIPAGINTFTLRSMDKAGNVSEKLVLSITGTSGTLAAPTINCPGQSEPTTDCVLTSSESAVILSGGHPGGAVVKGESAEAPGELFSISSTSAGDTSNDGSWSHSFAVVDGTNRFTLVSQKDGEISPPATLTISLDTTAPNPPQLNDIADVIGSNEVTVIGTNDDDVVSMCLRLGQNPNCDTIPNIPNLQSFAVDVPLELGDNILCFRASDAAGNQSAPACLETSRIEGPSLSILSPSSGATIAEDTMQIRINAQGNEEVGSEVIEVVYWLDTVLDSGGAQLSPDSLGDAGDYVGVADLSSFVNGTSHTLYVRATNALGLTTERNVRFAYQSGFTLVSDTGAPGHARDPQMVQDESGVVHIVWKDDCTQFASCTVNGRDGLTAPDIFYRSLDGDTWSDVMTVSVETADIIDGTSNDPALALSPSGTLHVVWSDNGESDSLTDYDLYHRSLDLSSGQWTDTEIIVDSDVIDAAPELQFDTDGRLHIVFVRSDYSSDPLSVDVFHTFNAGIAWATPIDVSNHAGDGLSSEPDFIITDDNVVHVTWQDTGTTTSSPSNEDSDIFYIRLAENGSSFAAIESEPILVSNNPIDDAAGRANPDNARSIQPTITAANDKIYIAWEDTTPAIESDTDSDIFIHTFQDGVIQEFPSTVYLAPTGSTSSSQQVSLLPLEDGRVMLTFIELDSLSFSEIKYSILRQSGVMTGVEVLGSGGGLAQSPQTILSGASVGLTWFDDSPIDELDFEQPNNGGPDDDVVFQWVPTP